MPNPCHIMMLNMISFSNSLTLSLFFFSLSLSFSLSLYLRLSSLTRGNEKRAASAQCQYALMDGHLQFTACDIEHLNKLRGSE